MARHATDRIRSSWTDHQQRMVFELLATRPAEESVGVVALFPAQADLIESLIEERRLLNRSLDDRFQRRPG